MSMVSTLSFIAGACLAAAVVRVRYRQRNREKMLATLVSMAIRSCRI